MRCSYPSWNLERWSLLGLLQTSAAGQEPLHDGTVQSAAQATKVYFDMLPVYLMLCVPFRVLRENGYSSAVYFLQKMLVTFLSQNERIQNSTLYKHNVNKWSRKSISPISYLQSLSINYLVYAKLSPASYYPAMKEKLLFKHPAWKTESYHYYKQ